MRKIYRGCRDVYFRRDRDAFLHQLAERLRELREDSGFNLSETAERARLTDAELEAIESGEREPFFYEVVRLCEIYLQPIDELLNDLIVNPE